MMSVHGLRYHGAGSPVSGARYQTGMDEDQVDTKTSVSQNAFCRPLKGEAGTTEASGWSLKSNVHLLDMVIALICAYARRHVVK